MLAGDGESLGQAPELERARAGKPLVTPPPNEVMSTHRHAEVASTWPRRPATPRDAPRRPGDMSATRRDVSATCRDVSATCPRRVRDVPRRVRDVSATCPQRVRDVSAMYSMV